MDLSRYRALFLEEAGDHLAEMSGALLRLEKEPGCREAIDLVFRMAHSVKSMAASLDYDAITTLSHALEDRMQRVRDAGCVAHDELGLLFRGLDALERMVSRVATTEACGAAELALEESLRAEPGSAQPARHGPASRPLDVAAGPTRVDAAPVRDASSAGAVAASVPVGSSAGAAPLPESAPLPLRGPSPSVRVRTDVLDRFLSTVGEVILVSSQVRTAGTAAASADPLFANGLDRMERMVGDLRRRVLELRTAPLLRIVETLPRLAREIAESLGKRVQVELRGAELELDRAILDRLGDPLVHLLRNAVDHGLEPPDARAHAGKPAHGTIVVEARREKDEVRIALRDDGRGIDVDAVRARAVAAGLLAPELAEDLGPSEIAALIFQPGLSTAAAVTDLSGRGVGMDAVKSVVESLGGRVELQTVRGAGTITTLVVPISAAVQRVLLLGVREATIAVPISKVERIVEVDRSEIERAEDEAFVLIDDEPMPVLVLSERIALGRVELPPMVVLALAEVRGARVALVVDRLCGQQEIYVKPVPALLRFVRALSGLTVLGDGRVVFLVDLNQLA